MQKIVNYINTITAVNVFSIMFMHYKQKWLTIFKILLISFKVVVYLEKPVIV